MNPEDRRQPRRIGGMILSLSAAATLSLGSSFVMGGGHNTAAAGASIWLQTMDSCRQALGSAQYQIQDSGSYSATVATPAGSPNSVGSGSCPIPRGNCSSMSTGCVQFANLPFPDTFRIRETAMPPSNPSNPQGFAPCTGGSACQSQSASVTIDSAGKVSAVTTNIEPDGATQHFPSSGSVSGSASDPIVFHDFGLGTGNCDGDKDADDHLTGTGPGSHCGYPEAQEASACTPYPWSCGFGGSPPPPPPPPPPCTTCPGPATHFTLTSPGSSKAGTSFTETVTALDKNNNKATSYTGGKTLSWTGPSSAPNGAAPHYPTNPVSFSSGVASAAVVLYDAQSTALTASDGSIKGTSPSVAIAPAGASQLTVQTPPGATAGSKFTTALSALDPYRNAATSYAGSKSLSWSGPSKAPNGTAPSFANPVSFTAGAASASITLYDAQSTAIKVSDGAITGATANFTVAPGPVASLALTLPASATFNQPVTATATTYDAWSNVATQDGSTLNISSSDLLATYPSSAGMSAGTTSFSVTFRTPGQQTLTVSESGGPSASKPVSVQL